VRARFGGRIKALVSGGAPLNPEVGLFFEAMGLTMLQGYGQTEAGPVIACNRPAAGIRMDTVGPPLGPRWSDRARWRNPGARRAGHARLLAQRCRNRARHPGRLAAHRRHRPYRQPGPIKITDRKKDMIVNDKGDNVSPQKIEGMLTLQPEIAQAMVSGDKRPYVVGLIVPDAEWAMQWSVDNDAPHDLARWPISRPSARGARSGGPGEPRSFGDRKVRQFALADEPFAIANEELTPS
jgi:long-chain acyl-CoA synthetase